MRMVIACTSITCFALFLEQFFAFLEACVDCGGVVPCVVALVTQYGVHGLFSGWGRHHVRQLGRSHFARSDLYHPASVFLSDQVRRSYFAEGYVILHNLVPAKTIAAFREELFSTVGPFDSNGWIESDAMFDFLAFGPFADVAAQLFNHTDVHLLYSVHHFRNDTTQKTPFIHYDSVEIGNRFPHARNTTDALVKLWFPLQDRSSGFWFLNHSTFESIILHTSNETMVSKFHAGELRPPAEVCVMPPCGLKLCGSVEFQLCEEFLNHMMVKPMLNLGDAMVHSSTVLHRSAPLAGDGVTGWIQVSFGVPDTRYSPIHNERYCDSGVSKTYSFADAPRIVDAPRPECFPRVRPFSRMPMGNIHLSTMHHENNGLSGRLTATCDLVKKVATARQSTGLRIFMDPPPTQVFVVAEDGRCSGGGYDTNMAAGDLVQVQQQMRYLSEGIAAVPWEFWKTPPAPAVLMPKLALPRGGHMPMAGLGTSFLSAKMILRFLLMGGRHLDSAQIYGNQAACGQAVRWAMKLGVPREEIFLVTKIHGGLFGAESTSLWVERMLQEFGLDYVDLVLLHGAGPEPGEWPVVSNKYPCGTPVQCRQETWETLAGFLANGKVRDIGVSNYGVRQMREIMALDVAKIAVNQLEWHPWVLDAEREAVEFCHQNGIAVTGYSPLGSGQIIKLFSEMPTFKSMANSHGKLPGQIMLRWAIQKNVSVIPRTTTAKRLITNLDIFGFELSDEDMVSIDEIEYRMTVAPNPWDSPDVPDMIWSGDESTFRREHLAWIAGKQAETKLP